MKEGNLASAPEQELMPPVPPARAQPAPKYQSEETDKAEPGCSPMTCLAMTPCGSKEAEEEEEEEIDPDAADATPSCLTEYCPMADTRIDEQKMLDTGWWCLYCCCAGVALGRFVHQTLAVRCGCFKFECDDVETSGAEGCASCIWSCSCLHLLFVAPPLHRSPTCICFNEMHGTLHKDEEQIEKDERDEEDSVDDESAFQFLLGEAFTVCYFKVMGCAVSSPSLFAKHLCGGFVKCGFFKCRHEMNVPCPEEDLEVEGTDCCLCLWTCLWFYWHYRFPPRGTFVANPCLAFLGCKLHHAHNWWYGIPQHGGEEEPPKEVKEVKVPN